jgi:hypothetical protein
MMDAGVTVGLGIDLYSKDDPWAAVGLRSVPDSTGDWSSWSMARSGSSRVVTAAPIAAMTTNATSTEETAMIAVIASGADNFPRFRAA